MPRTFATIVLSISALTLFTPLTQAAEIGCCEVRQTGSGDILETLNHTEEECKQIDLNATLKYTRFYEEKQASGDKKSCTDKTITNDKKEPSDPIYFRPGVSIPESDFISGKDVQVAESTATLANYIIAIFKYSTGVIGIIAAIALMLGGIIWLTAGGNHEKVNSAKTMIGSSLVGMCIAFSSFILLSLVNTNLVNLRTSSVERIEYIGVSKYGVGCCEKAKDVNGQLELTAEPLPKKQCEELTGYKSVVYKKGWVAENNKCEYPLGCCLIKSFSVSGDKAINITKAECRAQAEAIKKQGKNSAVFFSNEKKASPTQDECINGFPSDPNLDPPTYIAP